MKRPRFTIAVASIIGSLIAAPVAMAASDATWPERPIRIVVAQAAAGPPDLVARFVAEPLGRALGTPIVVDNRPGAGGIIGVDAVSRAAPDGYTLLIATLSTHALVPHVAAKVPYDPVRGFVPVANALPQPADPSLALSAALVARGDHVSTGS